MNKKKLLKIVDEEEDNFNWGGGEDKHGHLDRGNVDFDRIKKAIRELK